MDQHLSETIQELQAKKNEGRGVNCIRTLLFYYNRGDVTSAKNCLNNEGDKIRNYPDLHKLIKELLGGVE